MAIEQPTTPKQMALVVDEQPLSEALEAFIGGGDISKLSNEQRVIAYRSVCESLGLNYLTRPLDVIKDDGGKMRFYYRKEAADQLAKMHRISFRTLTREWLDTEIYCVTVEATTPDGRMLEEVGIVAIGEKVGAQGKANLLMKAQTKARRRATMALVGLGWQEVKDSVAHATLDPNTGMINGATEDAPALPLPSMTDISGDRTTDTAAQDAARLAGTPEAMAERAHVQRIMHIKNAREDYGIEAREFHAWIDRSAKADPNGYDFSKGLLQASASATEFVLDHLHRYKEQSCSVLLGGEQAAQETPADDAEEEAFMEQLQPHTDLSAPAIFPGMKNATTTRSEVQC